MSGSQIAAARVLRIAGTAIPLHLGAPALAPVRLSGREGVNALFEYELLLKTPDALNLGASGALDFDLDAFIGREIRCFIELDGAGEFIPGAVGPSNLQSLTIRDTQLDLLDLTGATVKGDVVMERVKGGAIKAGFASRNFTLQNSQIYGPAEQGRPVFDTAIAASEAFLIDNVQFASGLQDQVGLGEGRPLEASEWSAVPRNKVAIICNSKLPRVDASWLETQHLQLQGNEIGSLDLSNSRIGQLEIGGNTISRVVDLTNTQAKQASVQRLADRQAKLEGSNIKLPR